MRPPLSGVRGADETGKASDTQGGRARSVSGVRLFATPRTDGSPPGPSVHGDSPGKNRRGCHACLEGISPTQGWNPGLRRFLHCRRDHLAGRCFERSLLVQTPGKLTCAQMSAESGQARLGDGDGAASGRVPGAGGPP